ncbi:GyrI-like domain-containing protein [Pseudonocardia sp.]|uniref:GyrI-like domain-containing protein n=1 Tax=Pseudonocardia sp. TaxID=60912 RepID=UPI0026373ABC|nr:GyrI-like domain-containing protein [Pseudonocardia sp.]
MDISLATVPARALLVVDGRGAPEDPAFTAAVRALFAVRAALGATDDVPLEGTYAQDGDALRFDLDAPGGWHWTLAVPAPPGRTADAVSTAAARFGAPVELRAHPEQRVAQLVHRGPYADEKPSLAALYAHVAGRGLRPAGPHTEVYLTDPGTTAPGDNRAVLSVPVWTG